MTFRGCHGGDRVAGLWRAIRQIGRASAHRKVAAVDCGIRTARRFTADAAIGGDKAAKLSMEPVDVSLNVGARTLGRRLMGVAVDFLLALRNQFFKGHSLCAGHHLKD